MGHRQRVGLQIEVHRLHARQWLQHRAQLALFAGTVHLLDEVDDLLRRGFHDRPHADVVQRAQDGVLSSWFACDLKAATGQVESHIPDAIDLRQALANLSLLAGAIHVGYPEVGHEWLNGRRCAHGAR